MWSRFAYSILVGLAFALGSSAVAIPMSLVLGPSTPVLPASTSLPDTREALLDLLPFSGGLIAVWLLDLLRRKGHLPFQWRRSPLLVARIASVLVMLVGGVAGFVAGWGTVAVILFSI